MRNRVSLSRKNLNINILNFLINILIFIRKNAKCDIIINKVGEKDEDCNWIRPCGI